MQPYTLNVWWLGISYAGPDHTDGRARDPRMQRGEHGIPSVMTMHRMGFLSPRFWTWLTRKGRMTCRPRQH